ncbi:MAG: hypothetical protein ACYDEH_01210 [Acidimicrobiales bacterium]
MAELVVGETDLVLRLTSAEKVDGIHSDLRAPLSAVTGVEVLDDAHGAADIVGLRAGTRPAGHRGRLGHGVSRTIFVAVHHNTPRGVRVALRDQPYDEWTVGCADPEAVAARIPQAG